MQVKVERNGQLQQIPARELVRGDVMQLEEGDSPKGEATPTNFGGCAAGSCGKSIDRYR
jgi:hypothetical protein